MRHNLEEKLNSCYIVVVVVGSVTTSLNGFSALFLRPCSARFRMSRYDFLRCRHSRRVFKPFRIPAAASSNIIQGGNISRNDTLTIRSRVSILGWLITSLSSLSALFIRPCSALFLMSRYDFLHCLHSRHVFKPFRILAAASSNIIQGWNISRNDTLKIRSQVSILC